MNYLKYNVKIQFIQNCRSNQNIEIKLYSTIERKVFDICDYNSMIKNYGSIFIYLSLVIM